MVGAWAAMLVAFACRAALGIVTSLGLIAVGPLLAGMHSTVVMSDSMAPGIRSGDVVVVRAVPLDAVRPGLVVLVDDPDARGRLRLHRVIGVGSDGYRLQGDANAQPDSARIAPAAIHGVGFLRVPWIGLPVLWLRTGHLVPVVLTLVAAIAAAAAVALLDPPAPGSGVRPGRLVVPALRLLRRSRRVRAGAALAGLALAVVPPPHAPAASVSWAAFSGTSATPSTMRTGTWACPATPSPTPEILYSFMAPTDPAEVNRGSLNGYGATLTSASMRVVGNCTGNASPSIRFTGSGSEALVGGNQLPMGAQGSQSVWFSPAAATGVLVGLHSTSDASAQGADRQLYFTSAGGLAFAMRSGASVVTCSVPGAVALNTWHFASVVFNTTSKVFTLTLDDAASCSGTVSTPSTGAGVSRAGSDTPIAADASTAAYRGGIDEISAWSALLTPQQLTAVRAIGH